MAKKPLKKKTSTDDLNEYLQLMEEKNLHELEVCQGSYQIKLVRQSKMMMVPEAYAKSSAKSEPKEKKQEMSGHQVKSPIAGVFYRSRSPQSPPFVNVGDVVTAERPLCIIEAMKVMNEIVAGANGRVAKILVENGKSVEANQPLFILKEE